MSRLGLCCADGRLLPTPVPARPGGAPGQFLVKWSCIRRTNPAGKRFVDHRNCFINLGALVWVRPREACFAKRVASRCHR